MVSQNYRHLAIVIAVVEVNRNHELEALRSKQRSQLECKIGLSYIRISTELKWLHFTYFYVCERFQGEIKPHVLKRVPGHLKVHFL